MVRLAIDHRGFLAGLLLAMVVFAAEAALLAAPRDDDSRGNHSKPRRAKPPTWSQDDLDSFFKDARNALQGDRPYESEAHLASGRREAPGAKDASSSLIPPNLEGNGFRWSTIISAETIEDEIKRTKGRLVGPMKTPSIFKGGGYQACRSQFASLAVMFAIAAEYDADVRWKGNAASLRDMFGRAGFNCKVGSDGAYKEARHRVEDLETLIRGGRVSGPDAEARTNWEKVADIPPLMKRMEATYEELLKPHLANAGEFKNNADAIRHEAELTAMYAEVLAREGFEYSDDEEYVAYCHALRDAARAIVDAVQLKNYPQSREASGRISTTCSDCHEEYRA